MAWRRLLVVAVAAAVVASCTSHRSAAQKTTATPPPAAVDGDVRIDPAIRFQTIDGFGVSERVFEDPHLANAPQVSVPPEARRQVLETLYGRLGLTRLRPILDPPPTKPAVLDYSGKRADAHIELVKQAVPLGLKTFFPAPVALQPWMRNNPADYVDWALAMLRRWKDLGAEPPLFSLSNEPGDLPPEWMVTVATLLGPKLRAAGIQTKFVIPDDLNPTKGYPRAVAVLENAEARQYVGALAYHIYIDANLADAISRFKDLGAQYHLPVWMTEYGGKDYGSWPGALGWARTMHSLLTQGNVSAVDYLWGFFGSWQASQTLVSLNFDQGRYQSFATQPIYDLTGQYSRFVRPGCVRVEAASSIANVLSTAFSCSARELVVVAINAGKGPLSVAFATAQHAIVGKVKMVRTGPSEAGVSLPSLAARQKGFSATLPAGTVTTFVARLSG